MTPITILLFLSLAILGNTSDAENEVKIDAETNGLGGNGNNSDATAFDEGWFPSDEDFTAADSLDDDLRSPKKDFGCTARREQSIGRSNVFREQDKWPQVAKGEPIPIKIHPQYETADRGEWKKIIANAIQGYDKLTNGCIKFRKATPADKSYIQLNPGKVCNSPVGRQSSGINLVNLNLRGCKSVSTVQHELMHSLGFEHEQCRFDRDKFVTIQPNNLKSQQEKFNFDITKQNRQEVGQYDYKSVMHYAGDAFAKPGTITIKTKDPNMQKVIGRAPQLSPQDVQKLRTVYKCDQIKKPSRR